MYEQHRRCLPRRALAVMALAALFAVVSTIFVVPAGAGVAVPQSTHMSERSLQGHASAKKPKKPKKAKPAKAASGHGHLSKKDDVEILLLVLAPFIVTGLFLVGSGYRRRQETSPTLVAQPHARRRWRPSPWRRKS
jgi:hypothetical protein